MPEDQINEVFETMFEAVRQRQAPAGRDLSGMPAHSRPAEPQTPKVPTRDELKEYFDPSSDKFDPQAAMKMMVEANYSPLLADIGRNASVGLKAAVAAQLPDFKEYEADVDKVLEQLAPNQINQNVIATTYFQVKGLRQTQKEIRDRAKPPTTVTPSPAAAPAADAKAGMTAEEIQIAGVMFRGSADPIAEYKKAASMMENQQMRVPGDPKPKAAKT